MTKSEIISVFNNCRFTLLQQVEALKKTLENWNANEGYTLTIGAGVPQLDYYYIDETTGEVKTARTEESQSIKKYYHVWAVDIQTLTPLEYTFKGALYFSDSSGVLIDGIYTQIPAFILMSNNTIEVNNDE